MWSHYKEWWCIMDIKERITELNKEYGWSLYRLSREAGMAPSTLTNMMKRGNCLSLSSLERVCEAYGITMLQFFYDGEEMVPLNAEQREHLECWNRLAPGQKKTLSLIMESFLNGE
jgi:transcriptional regulator with XRE-family HTH domain